MSFLSKIGSAFKSVVSVVGKGLDILKAPLDFVMKPIQGALEKVADKLPFGLGKIVKPFISTFLDQAVGWLAGGPLGGVFSLVSKGANTASKIDDILHTVDGALGGGILGLPQEAQDNVAEGTAWAQAQTLLAD
jgi:hypothetical protein